jgi:hypothetical protein
VDVVATGVPVPAFVPLAEKEVVEHRAMGSLLLFCVMTARTR